MRIYKATYKDREGKQLKSAKCYLDFADHNQRIMRNPIAKLAKPVRDSEKKGVLEPETLALLFCPPAWTKSAQEERFS